jgi:hypothetical protein
VFFVKVWFGSGGELASSGLCCTYWEYLALGVYQHLLAASTCSDSATRRALHFEGWDHLLADFSTHSPVLFHSVVGVWRNRSHWLGDCLSSVWLR